MNDISSEYQRWWCYLLNYITTLQTLRCLILSLTVSSSQSQEQLLSDLQSLCCWMHSQSTHRQYIRVSKTPGNPGNLLEFVWSSWKFLCKMSMIDCIGFQSWWNWVPDHLFKKLVALFIFATAPILCISCFCSIFRQTSRFGTLHSRSKQCKHVLDFSWNPSWNLLEICSVKLVDTLYMDWQQ